jgi:hypothetical protein
MAWHFRRHGRGLVHFSSFSLFLLLLLLLLLMRVDAVGIGCLWGCGGVVGLQRHLVMFASSDAFVMIQSCLLLLLLLVA